MIWSRKLNPDPDRGLSHTRTSARSGNRRRDSAFSFGDRNLSLGSFSPAQPIRNRDPSHRASACSGCRVRIRLRWRRIWASIGFDGAELGDAFCFWVCCVVVEEACELRQQIEEYHLWRRGCVRYRHHFVQHKANKRYRRAVTRNWSVVVASQQVQMLLDLGQNETQQ